MSQSLHRSLESDYPALVGIDWADREHAVTLFDVGGDAIERYTLAQTPEALDAWAQQLRRRFEGRPIAVALEQSRGALIYALMKYPHLHLYPVPPARLAAYRKAFVTSGAKDDPTDADLILDYLRHHREHLHLWRPEPTPNRKLALLVEKRRAFVDRRTALTNALTAELKNTFPQALDWLGGNLYSRMACDFLIKWPNLQSLQRAKTDTIRRFYYAHNVRRGETIEKRLEAIAVASPLVDDEALLDVGAISIAGLAESLHVLRRTIDRLEQETARVFAEHEDAALFRDLPGAGKALAPRLCCAFGSDRDRFADAHELQVFTGIAPVTKRSGKSMIVQRRWACPTFLKQTFHEFADYSRRRCDWAKAYYQLQRARGKGHHAALRALAYKWQRILFVCWKTRTPYNDARYVAELRAKNSPLLQYLPDAA